MRYNLSENQADRINFDQMTERGTEAMLGALSAAEAAQVNPDEYAMIVWEQTEASIEYGGLEVDDIEEARVRTLATAKQSVKDYQEANA